MKRFFLFVCLWVLGIAWPCHAGTWQLDRYEVRLNAYGERHYASSVGWDGQYQAPLQKDTVTPLNTYRGETEQRYPVSLQLPADRSAGSGEQLNYSARRYLETPAFMMKPGRAFSTMTVTPVFKWQPSGLNDPPSGEFWIREVGRAEVWMSHGYNEAGYTTEETRYQGENFQTVRLDHGLGDVPAAYSRDYPYGYRVARDSVAADKAKLIASHGAIEVYGPTRGLKAEVSSPGWNTPKLRADWYGQDPNASASVNLQYTAEVCRFSLDVSVPSEIGRQEPDHPRDHNLAAYAGKSYTNSWPGAPPETATTFFWDGFANYGAGLSPNLLGIIGNPTYKWSLKDKFLEANPGFASPLREFSVPASSLSPDPSQEARDQSDPDKSTPSKSIHHDLGVNEAASAGNANINRGFNGPRQTVMRLEVTGDNPQKSKLTAKAKINWYEPPKTLFRSEVETEVIDYTTGTVKTLDEVMQGNQNPLSTEEEATAEAFKTEYEAMKKEFVSTGAQYVGMALETEMMVGSWYVPDEVDVGTFGLSLLGKPIRKLFKVAKTAKAAVELAAKINRVRDKLSAMVPAVKKALGHDNFLIVMKRKKFRELRGGHVGSDGKRIEATMGEVKEEEEVLCSIPGGSCFVAGTKVSGKDGFFVIEGLKKGDMVWSRDAATGKTELKRVKQTFERHAVTLILTFSNGEKIETTKEHPFFVEKHEL